VPGHKGGGGAGAQLVDAIGERALRLDVPACTYGIDIGAEPTPLARSETLAADLWGAQRAWFLVNGASQGNQAVCLALAQAGDRVVVQRNVHSSTVSGLVLSGLRPSFVAPEVDPELGIAHCMTPDALDRALSEEPQAVAAFAVSPTYYGAVADIPGLVRVARSHGVPLVVDEAWGAHLAFHEDLPDPALADGADVVISGTHKIVGSLTQSALMFLGWGAERWIDRDALTRALTLTASTSPNALLLGSLDAARRHVALNGRMQLESTLELIESTRSAIRAIPGLEVLDETLIGRPGIAAYDPLRVVVDIRGTGRSGFELAAHLRESSGVFLEFVEESVIVALFGLGGSGRAESARLAEALRAAVRDLAGPGTLPGRVPAGQRAPSWGPLEMSPRDAFLSPQQVVPIELAVGRVAAESLAVYPPGIANALPGERLLAPTLAHVRRVSEAGGRVRGASDPTLRTVRVVAEA
jgi:lysine decarboxylase